MLVIQNMLLSSFPTKMQRKIQEIKEVNFDILSPGHSQEPFALLGF